MYVHVLLCNCMYARAPGPLALHRRICTIFSVQLIDTFERTEAISMATPRNGTFRAKIREELICAVCLDFLQEPKVLLCAHSFCKVCLERIISTSCRLNAQQNKRDLECPSCRQITQLTTENVSELKTNFNLKRLVNIVSEEDKKAARDVLQRRRTVRPSIRSTHSLCKQHHKQFEYYCLDCSELLCPRCVTAGHRDHQFQDVDQVLPREIEQLRSLIQPACEVRQEMPLCLCV